MRWIVVVLMLGTCGKLSAVESPSREMPEKIISDATVRLGSSPRVNSLVSNLKHPLPSRPVSSESRRSSLDGSILGKWKKYTQFGKVGSILLGVVTAGITAWRWLRPANMVPIRSPLEELGTMVLFGKMTARLVLCADRVLILADTPQGIVKLTEISDPTMVARIVREYVGT